MGSQVSGRKVDRLAHIEKQMERPSTKWAGWSREYRVEAVGGRG